MKVIFKRKSTNLESLLVVHRFVRLWEAYGNTAIAAFALHTGLKFGHRQLTVYVDRRDGGSHSGDIGMPMAISYEDNAGFQRYSDEQLVCTLLHELAHRLLISNGIRSKRTDYGYHRMYLAHKRIDLFLYDVWVDVVGERAAEKELVRELYLRKPYQDAWHWALNKTYEERQKEIALLKRRIKSKNTIPG